MTDHDTTMLDYHDETCQGLHDPAHPSCFDGIELPFEARFVERCDEFSTFDDDGDAAIDAGLVGTWVECDHGGAHYLVGCQPEEAGLERLDE